MIQIVIVEDNEAIRESVKSYLELENYKVYDFDKAYGVLDAISYKNIDLIILDVMLPDENGFLLAKEIKKEHDVPIIFLTARDSESDRITGFELGGEDYIVKPFSPKELVLRVKSILKRVNKTQDKKIFLNFKKDGHELLLDNVTHKASLDVKEMYLTSSEWEILIYLASNPGMVLSREKILGQCLDYMSEGSERTVDTHIKNLRAKLGDSEWIETVRNYGYKFTGEKS